MPPPNPALSAIIQAHPTDFSAAFANCDCPAADNQLHYLSLLRTAVQLPIFIDVDVHNAQLSLELSLDIVGTGPACTTNICASMFTVRGVNCPPDPDIECEIVAQQNPTQLPYVPPPYQTIAEAVLEIDLPDPVLTLNPSPFCGLVHAAVTTDCPTNTWLFVSPGPGPMPGLTADLYAAGGTYDVTAYSALVEGGLCQSIPINENVFVNEITGVSISGNLNFCSGGITVLTCSEALGGYYWYTAPPPGPNDIIPFTGQNSITVTSPGSYSVIGADESGCTATATVTVTENTNPIVTVNGNATLCNGANTTTLTATGADTYVWSTGETTAVITAQAGSYSVTGTDANGCTASASVTVTIGSAPTITITGLQYTCAGQTTTLSANGAISYIWSTGATSTSITVSQAGTYTVTGTNADGCTGSATFVFATVNCCGNPNAIAVGSGVGIETFEEARNVYNLLAPPAQLPLPPQIIAVYGTFTFDAYTDNNGDWIDGYTISGSEIIMTNGAEIIVGPDMHLVFTFVNTHDCGDFWRSITVFGGFSARDCVFEGGEYCVRAEDKSYIGLDINTFQRCHAGLYVPPAPSGSGMQTINHTPPVGNIFRRGTGTWPAPYTVGGAQPTITSFEGRRLGIDLNDVSFFSIGQFPTLTNEFINLPVGIRLRRNGYVKIRGCHFKDVPSGIHNIGPGNAMGSPGLLYVEGLGKMGSPTFENFNPAFALTPTTAIYSSLSDLIVEQVRVDNYETGLSVQNSANCDVNISENTLFCTLRGIKFVSSLPAANQHFLEHNLISMRGNDAIGIEASGVVNGPPSRLGINDNEIELALPPPGGTYSNGTGIGVTNAEYVDLKGNRVFLRRASCQYGINLSGSAYSLVECNMVAGTAAWGTDPNMMMAYRFLDCPGLLINCNGADETYSAYRFEGDNTGSLFEGNNIRNHTTGLWHSSGVVGDQHNLNNQWLDGGCTIYADGLPSSSTDFHFEVESSSPSDFPQVVTILGVPVLPVINNTWIQVNANIPYDCLGTYCGIAPWRPAIVNQASNHIGAFEKYLAGGDPNLPDYQDPINWTADKAIYHKLLKHPNLAVQDTILENFIVQKSTESLGKFAMEEKQASDTIFIKESQKTLYDSLLFKMKHLQLNLDSIQDLYLNNGMDSTTYILSTEPLMDSLSHISEALTQLLEEHKASIQVPMDSLSNVNQGISATSIHEQNNKAVNDVYLATWAKGIHEFTVEQKTVLESIIWQCPLSAGPAIFLARAMYAEIENTIYFDEEACWSQGILLRQQERVPHFNGLVVYPNPTSGNLKISLLDNAFIASNISIFNSFGNKLVSNSCGSNQISWDISIVDLPLGIYTVVLTAIDGKTKREQVVLIK